MLQLPTLETKPSVICAKKGKKNKGDGKKQNKLFNLVCIDKNCSSMDSQAFEKFENAIFFLRYSKFLPRGNWYRSRTSPKFFSKKNFNKCGRKSRPKFWPKWAVAGRLVEQGQKIFRQFSADT